MLNKTILGAAVALLLTACGQNQTNHAANPAPAVSAPAAASASNVAVASQAVAPNSGNLMAKINNKETLLVGTMGTYPPFTYHEKDGKLTGYDVEVTRAVAAKLGVQVEFKETPWDAMMAGLKAGRFDLVANQVALTSPERQAMFDKAEPYSWSGKMIVARADHAPIAKLEDIKGMKTTVMFGSNYDEVATKMGADLVHTDTMSQGLMNVQQKRADITLNDELSLLDYLKKNPDSGLKYVWRTPAEEKLGAGLVMNKGNEEALAKISSVMQELKADGTLKKLGEQFFGEDVSNK
ncbi:transporter substrate-binding domain-containing protein [Alysiella crassa]|uniref:Probable amino-acid ABC transporter-binding protein HI_1080 n=1 Tax=Alysiella crassa TaxID=153491 RepID=A0A376BLP7_9NEIS|nr:transporter substrate-binding domain-containing protein [Alysiella crassa]UOP07627.1 transporter substrate-binding domain-containing protein [Alysiella crassa]SSY70144.1 Probable amino-acid ABC transporter-binding protein HI_1080 precursor [Alysiella crassa]